MIRPIQALETNKDIDEIDSQLVTRVNEEIHQLNILIHRYNEQDPKSPTGKRLLATIYQSRQIRLDRILAQLSMVNAVTPLFVKQFLDDYNNHFLSDLRESFLDIDVLSLNKNNVEQWDIFTNSATKGLETTVKLRTTKPIDSISGEIQRLLRNIDYSRLEELSTSNYYQLSNLKHNLRSLLVDGQLSSQHEKIIAQLIALTNFHLANLLSQSKSLNDHLFSEMHAITASIDNWPQTLITELVEDLKDPENHNPTLINQLNCNLTYLGGGNAHNYLLYDPVKQQEFVLKITPTFENTQLCAERLRHTLVNDNLARIYSRRSGIQSEDGKLYQIELTEFCARGDLLSDSNNHPQPADKLQRAAEIYSQKAQVLIHFVANQALFADPKPTNWLLTGEGRLVIADTKSFLDTKEQTFSQTDLEPGQAYLHSHGFSPPELQRRADISNTDKHQAYLLGLSLYLYLSEKGSQDLFEGVCGSLRQDAISVDLPIFQSEIGEQFQLLISALMTENPYERIGLMEAAIRLEAVQVNLRAGETLSNSSAPAASSSSSASSSSHHLLNPMPSSSAGLALHNQEFKYLHLLRIHLEEQYSSASLAGNVPKTIKKIIECTDLKQVGEIAQTASKEFAPMRAEKLINLYSLLSELKTGERNPAQIYQAMLDLNKKTLSPSSPSKRR